MATSCSDQSQQFEEPRDSALDEENERYPKQPAQGDENEVDGGYGWVCLVCMLLITANTWGVNGSFGVFLARYLDSDLFPGTRETTYAFIGGLSISQITTIAPLVTWTGKRFGLHANLSIGIVLETAALLLSSFATRVWHLFLTQGVLFGWGCSFLYVGSMGVVPQWFSRRRSFATALAASGSGLGGMAYSLGVEAMITSPALGLWWAFRITAIVTFACNCVCAILIRNRNKAILPDESMFKLELLRQPKMLIIIAWAYFSTLGYTMVLFIVPDDALAMGATFKQAAIAGAVVNLGMAIGRPFIGYLSDSFGRIKVTGVACLLCSLFSFCIWIPAKTYAVLIVFALLGGMTCGTFYSAVAPLLAQTFGVKMLPAALSIIWTVIVLPTTFAAPLAILMRTNSTVTTYLPVHAFVGAMFMAAAVCMIILLMVVRRWSREPGWKINFINAITEKS